MEGVDIERGRETEIEGKRDGREYILYRERGRKRNRETNRGRGK